MNQDYKPSAGAHPITPPPELVQEWARYQGFESPEVLWRQIATEAARWGADQELEACCQWLEWQKLATHQHLIAYLRASRRPKPPSLKEQALARTDAILNDRNHALLIEVREILELNRRALEQLPDAL